MRTDFHPSQWGQHALRTAMLLLALFCCAPPALAQMQSAALTASGAVTAEPGEVFEVTVSLGSLFNVTELAAVKFAVGFDSDVLIPIDATPGPALGAWPLADFEAFPGVVGGSPALIVTGLTDPAVGVGAGVLATLRFEVREDAVDAAVSELTILGSEPGVPAVLLDDLQAEETGIKVSTTGSSVTVVGGLPCTPGDADLDGQITTADAILVLRSIVALAQLTPQQNCNADANVDGMINTGDAVRILRTVVGLSKSFAPVSASAHLEFVPGGARLVIEPAMGVHGVQATVRTPRDVSLAALESPTHGLLLDAAAGDLHRIVWAAAEELRGAAQTLQIELPLRGDGTVQLVELHIFDANGAEIPLRIEGANLPAGDRHASVRMSNHPNPFNPSTKIQFELPSRAAARIELFNAAGQRVRVLVDRELAEGTHEVVWNGTDDGGRPVSSGVYFARLASEAGATSHRLLLVK